MASSKGGKSAGNVMNLDDARKKRELRRGSSSCEGFSEDHEQPEAADPVSAKETRAESQTASGKIKPKPGNRSFNKEKVDRIKGEIARGEYKIDYFEVADKYIEHERFS